MKERYEFDKMEGCEWIRDTEELNQPLYYDLETVSNILNKQDKIIKQLETHAESLENIKAIEIVNAIKGYENQIRNLKQAQNEKAIKVLEMMIEEIRSLNMPNKPELYNNDMFVTGFESHYLGVERIIDNQIKELKREE